MRRLRDLSRFIRVSLGLRSRVREGLDWSGLIWRERWVEDRMNYCICWLIGRAFYFNGCIIVLKDWQVATLHSRNAINSRQMWPHTVLTGVSLTLLRT